MTHARNRKKTRFGKTIFCHMCQRVNGTNISQIFYSCQKCAFVLPLLRPPAIQLATFQFKRLAREERKILPTEKMRRNCAPLKKKFFLLPPWPTFLLLQADLIYSADFRVNKLPHFFDFEEGGGRVKNQALLGSRVWPKFATTSFPFPRNLCILFYF